MEELKEVADLGDLDLEALGEIGGLHEDGCTRTATPPYPHPCTPRTSHGLQGFGGSFRIGFAGGCRWSGCPSFATLPWWVLSVFRSVFGCTCVWSVVVLHYSEDSMGDGAGTLRVRHVMAPRVKALQVDRHDLQ